MACEQGDCSLNYPNPFNASALFSFFIQQPGYVTMEIFNSNGQRINTLVHSFLSSGYYTARFNAGHLSSGIYYCMLNTGYSKKSRVFTVIK